VEVETPLEVTVAQMVSGKKLTLLICAITATAAATAPTVVTPLRDGAVLYASPSTRDDSLGALPVGSIARVVSGGTEWLRVRAPNGAEAWVERHAVAAP
jgi:hypothetical protein